MRLSRVDKRKLEDLVLFNKEKIERGDWSVAGFAKVATEALSTFITTGHIYGAAKAVEVAFVKRQRMTAVKEENAEIKKLKLYIAILTKEITEIYAILRTPPCPIFVSGLLHNTEIEAIYAEKVKKHD